MSDKLLQIAIALLSHEPGARVTIKGGPEMGIRALDYLISLATQAKMRLRGETQNAAAGHHRAVPATRAMERVPAAATPRDGEDRTIDAPARGQMDFVSPSPQNRSVQGRCMVVAPATVSVVPAAAVPLSPAGRVLRDRLERRAVAPIMIRLSDGSDVADYTYAGILDKRQKTRRDAFVIDCVLAVGIPENPNVRVSDYVTPSQLGQIAWRAAQAEITHG